MRRGKPPAFASGDGWFLLCRRGRFDHRPDRLRVAGRRRFGSGRLGRTFQNGGLGIRERRRPHHLHFGKVAAGPLRGRGIVFGGGRGWGGRFGLRVGRGSLRPPDRGGGRFRAGFRQGLFVEPEEGRKQEGGLEHHDRRCRRHGQDVQPIHPPSLVKDQGLHLLVLQPQPAQFEDVAVPERFPAQGFSVADERLGADAGFHVDRPVVPDEDRVVLPGRRVVEMDAQVRFRPGLDRRLADDHPPALVGAFEEDQPVHKSALGHETASVRQAAPGRKSRVGHPVKLGARQESG